MKRPFTSFIAITILFFSLPNVIFAQTTNTQIIKVSPIILRLSLEPGKTTDYTITISNLTSFPMPLKATVESFDSTDEERGFTPTTPIEKNPLQDWIHINEPDLLISPNSSQDEHVQISIPSHIPLGGYFAMIYFQPLIASSDVTVNAKVGVLTLANIGVQDDTNNKAHILNFDFGKSLFQDNPIDYLMRLQNTSLNYFTAKPILKVKPLFGPEEIIPLEEKTILPGKVRRWNNQFEVKKPFSGIYFAKLDISTEGGSKVSVTKQFFVFPLTKILLQSAVIFIILSLLLFRKRIGKALKLLIKG